MNEGSSLYLNKDRSGRRRTERTQESINLLQEKLIEDPRISIKKNGLDISKSTLNRITKRDLKYHLYKIHVWKERNNYISSSFTEKKSGFIYKSYGRSAKKEASLPSKKWRTYWRKRKLAAYIRRIRIYSAFVINIEIKITLFYNYLLLYGFENVYLMFEAVFYFFDAFLKSILICI